MKNVLFTAFVLATSFSAGCTTQRSPAIKAIDAAAFCEANAGLDYAACRPRDTEEELKAALIADITLMDVDGATARRMLDLRGHADISPRAYKGPLGETLAAFIGMNDAGEVLLRPSLAITPSVPLTVRYNRDIAWVSDEIAHSGEGGTILPVISSIWVGARATLQVNEQADGSYQVSLDSEAAQVALPIPATLTSYGLGKPGKVQTPQVVNQKRVATQGVRLSETAVFVLSAVEGENPVVRLLFVRLEKP